MPSEFNVKTPYVPVSSDPTVPLVPLLFSLPVRISVTDASPTLRAAAPLSVSFESKPALSGVTESVLPASTAPVSFTPTTLLSAPLTVIVNVAVAVAPFSSVTVYVNTSVSLEPLAILSAASWSAI